MDEIIDRSPGLTFQRKRELAEKNFLKNDSSYETVRLTFIERFDLIELNRLTASRLIFSSISDQFD